MIATFSAAPITYLLQLEPAGASPGALESRGTPVRGRIDSTTRLSLQDHTTPPPHQASFHSRLQPRRSPDARASSNRAGLWATSGAAQTRSEGTNHARLRQEAVPCSMTSPPPVTENQAKEQQAVARNHFVASRRRSGRRRGR